VNKPYLKALSKSIDTLSAFFANRKGALPMFGILLVITNFFINLFFPGFLSESDLLLHLGIILSVVGLMLAWAL